MSKPERISPLALESVDVLLKRVSSNFERHGDEHVPVLDIACECAVPFATVESLLGKYADRGLFEKKKDILQPASWLAENFELPLHYTADLQASYVAFVLSDKAVREFGEEPDEGEEAKPHQLCPITKITAAPLVGGTVHLTFTLRIRPNNAKEIWAFMEHHQRHATLTIDDSSVKVRNSKQGELPLVTPTDADKPTVSAEDAKGAAAANTVRASDGAAAAASAKDPADAKKEAAEFEAAANAQVEAFKKGRRGKVAAIDGRTPKGAH